LQIKARSKEAKHLGAFAAVENRKHSLGSTRHN
jgi:hypothetical protein